jgi:ferritin-like metal-binding protein YciE
VRTYARLLGNNQVAGLLQQTLDEEAKTDEKLTMLAEHGPNVQAKQEGDGRSRRS